MSSNKLIYLASPFFTPTQLATVQAIEEAIAATPGLECYSPRKDGVLQDMSSEERAASYARVYQKNTDMIETCDALIAVLDEKDSGTLFEMGYARGYHGSSNMTFHMFSFTSAVQTKTNVMLGQSTDGHVTGLSELKALLHILARDEFVPTKVSTVEQF